MMRMRFIKVLRTFEDALLSVLKEPGRSRGGRNILFGWQRRCTPIGATIVPYYRSDSKILRDYK